MKSVASTAAAVDSIASQFLITYVAATFTDVFLVVLAALAGVSAAESRGCSVLPTAIILPVSLTYPVLPCHRPLSLCAVLGLMAALFMCRCPCQ